MITIYGLLSFMDRFLLYMLYGFFLRSGLKRLLPDDIFVGFDEMARYFRNKVSNLIERIWGSDNGEVLFISRVLGPFTIMIFVDSIVAALYYTTGEHLSLVILFFIFRLFVFMNVAPTKEDWQIFMATPSITRLWLIPKIILLVPAILKIQRQEIDIDLSFIVVLLFCIPLTAFKDIGLNFE